MTEQTADAGGADQSADQDVPVEDGTAGGNPVAGLELDRDDTPPVVSGDTGPEGNRQTSLAPPTS